MSRPFIWIMLALMMAVGGYLRVHGTTEYHYSHDELMHLTIAKGHSIAQILQFAHFEVHPPLFYLLLHGWLGISENPLFTRCFSLLFGLAAIPLYYLISNRLGGPLAGLCTALLVTFSHGLIVQSYVLRQYSLFFFLLSVCFYAYLRWRSEHSNEMLGMYGIFGALACLTHFTGLFAVIVMAASEAIWLRISNTSLKRQATWACVNLAIFIMGALLIYSWHNALANFRSDDPQTMEFGQMLLQKAAGILLYPYQTFSYLFADEALAMLCAFMLPFAVQYSLLHRSYNNTLPWLALAFGAALHVSVYSFIGRHNLWPGPFILPFAGCLLALTASGLSTLRKKKILWEHALIAILLLAGILTYDPQERFGHSNEYLLKEADWHDMHAYVNSLDATHVVISEKGEAFLLQPQGVNLYEPLMKSVSYSDLAAAAFIPLHQAHLMFRTLYLHYDTDTFVRMMQQAQQNGTLNGIDTLVFLRVSSSRTAIFNLLRCKQLDKTILLFPRMPEPYTAHDISSSPVAFVQVNKKAFFDQFVSEKGKAHACMHND